MWRAPLAACLLLALSAPPALGLSRPAHIAAVQVLLRDRGAYAGPVTGALDPQTVAAVRAFQARRGLARDGVPGPVTRGALGSGGRPPGARLLGVGAAGFDVVALQFELARHGFPSGPFTARLTPRVQAAVLRFQRWARLPQTGLAGPLTFAALRNPPPRPSRRLRSPVAGAVTGGFGPRGDRFHAGVDVAASAGTPVAAPAAGRVTFAGWREGGFGLTVVVAHGGGLRTLLAHLSRVDVDVGRRVRAGDLLGAVGATGAADGPHLHLEVRLRGACIDPLPLLR